MSRRLLLPWAAAGVLGSALSVPAVAQEQAIEEIIVTGSFIRRDSFDMSSPLDVMNEYQLQEQGTPNLGEVLRNSTYNYGVESVGNILAAEPQTAGVQGANFRGLGERATLTLLDGRRTASANLANLYPQIMIERTESLTDGGATLYGTDAVGGVFNIIPKHDYEGVAVQIGTNQADGWHEHAASILIGGGNETSRFVAAAEMRRKDSLEFFERKQYTLGAASYSSTSWPGDFLVANRDVSGNIIGVSSRPDPGCGMNNDVTGDATEVKGAGVLGSRQGQLRGSCRWEFGQNFNFQDEQDILTTAVNFEHAFNDRIRFSGEVMFSRNEVITRGSPSNPGGRQGELTAIPGDNPGNPYRAFYDADLDGVYDIGDGDALLYAQDANGDGIPDRNEGVDIDQNGMDDVILAADPFSAASGIPFSEDTVIVDWRPVGYPYDGPSRLNDDRTSKGAGELDSRNIRVVGQVDIDLTESWSGYVSYVYNNLNYDVGGTGESLSAINDGINGTLLVRDEPNAASRAAWFNPFTTQNFVCENRDCSGGVRQTDPDQINSTAVYDQVAFFDPTNETEVLEIWEMVATGDLFEFGAGTVQAAVGAQYRDASYEVDAGTVSNALDLWIGVGQPDFKVDRQTTAVFGELAIPLFENFEIDMSIRSEFVEDDSPEDLDHTDYRIGVRFEPVDFLALRASWNTSFIAPGLDQLYDPSSLQGLSQITDGFTGISAFTARTTGGTPTLKPEEADIYNIGASLFLLDGDLRFDLDWKFFDFTDRIIRPAAQEILDADEAAAAAAGFDVSPTGLPAWLASGLANPGIQRSPINQQIQLVITDQINAQEMEWKGIDLSVNYAFDAEDIPLIGGDYGIFNVGLDATWVDAYNYTSFTGEEIEGAGFRNNRVAAVPPTPEWKANLRVAWNLGNHQVVAYGRYLDGVGKADDGDPFCTTSPATLAFFRSLGVTNPCPTELSSYTTWDFQYSYAAPLFFDNGETSIQVGLINAFDKEAEAIVTLGGLETNLYDPRGQTWYVRLRQDF